MKVRVSPMTSQRSGNAVANQYIIHTSNEEGYTESFQSYRVICAEVKNGNVTLDSNYWDYSRTTLKYLKQFLGTSDSVANIRKKIEDGVYKLGDLNS